APVTARSLTVVTATATALSRAKTVHKIAEPLRSLARANLIAVPVKYAAAKPLVTSACQPGSVTKHTGTSKRNEIHFQASVRPLIHIGRIAGLKVVVVSYKRRSKEGVDVT
ncbi:MAG TPA: hypothetical protein DCQ06_01100, partial [Myxococcales bacterium]|nr:hypothetical protein [Myxococcales bacterium]